jgi:hypothetical protein
MFKMLMNNHMSATIRFIELINKKYFHTDKQDHYLVVYNHTTKIKIFFVVSLFYSTIFFSSIIKDISQKTISFLN